MILFNEKAHFFYSTKINDQYFFSGFGTKQSGDGKNINNIFNFFLKQKISFDQIVVPNQIHSINVDFVNQIKNKKRIIIVEDTDGVITTLDKNILTVATADCVPIIFADKSGGVIGISHQGWRGSLKGMAGKMVQKMVEAGADKRQIGIAIGPSIGACCYDIDDDRFFEFKNTFDGYSDKIFTFNRGKRYINLALLNYLQLKDEGVKAENIDFFPFCTACDKERFLSYRRDRKKEFGEMFSFIVKY